jgi:SNF2 family DNA or RNA helicase
MLIMMSKEKGYFIFGCSDRGKLDLAQSIAGGKKVRSQNQIIMHQKAFINLLRYPEFKDVKYESDQVKGIVSKTISAYNLRVENIDRVKKISGKFNYEYKGIYPDIMDHQKVMFNAMMYSDCCALLSDPGTCKTGPYIWAIDQRIKMGKIKKCLVITLSTLKENVLEEMRVQAPHLKGVILSDRSTSDKILNQKYKIQKYNKDYDVYVSNYESMFSLVEVIDDDYFDMVICDEAHRIGSPDSNQTNAIVDKFENVKYKYIITGTLNANNLMSFFMPFRFLGADTVPVSSYNTYKQQHMRSVDPDKRIWVPVSKWDVDFTSKIIGKISVMFKKEDCLDLPPLIRKFMYCDLFGDQKKVYDQMKVELLATIDDICGKCDHQGSCTNQCDKDMEAKNALVLVTKLSQITSGFYKNTRYNVDMDGREEDVSNIIYFENNAKIYSLIDTMRDLPKDKKTIIWSHSIPAIGLIKKAVGNEFGEDSYLTCYGQQNAFEQIEKFRSTDCLWMIANQSKMGVGHNIQFSSYQIFYNNSYSFIQKDQAESRQHRKGQLEKVTVIELVARKTIDERIAQVIDDKKDLSLTLSQWAKVFRR